MGKVAARAVVTEVIRAHVRGVGRAFQKAIEVGLAGMVVLADQALGQTLALLATFLGIGVIVNLLVVYIIGQVLAERRENQERQQRLSQQQR